MAMDNSGLSRLFAAVVSDVLDALGHAGQAMLPLIRPLDAELRLCGRARTGLFASCYEVAEGENPYEIELELMDSLRPGEVPVFACGGPPTRITPWGELMTTAALQRGAVGFVTDGLVRDTRAIRAAGFPVFHGGICPLDSRGRGKMIARDVLVRCGGVDIRSGDLIVGDADGVVVIPAAIERQVIERSLEKINGENRTRRELLSGSLLGEVYARYGIL